MIVYPLGVGSAFTQGYYHNNFLVELNDQKLLIDAGTTLRYSLKSAGFTESSIHYVIITHFHFDHVGGLEELLLKRYWSRHPAKEKIQIITHEKQRNMLENILMPGLNNQNLTLRDYAGLITVEDEQPVPIGPFRIQMIETTHLHAIGMQSFALKIFDQNTGCNFLFTSDIKNLKGSNLLDYIDEKTEFIFQDVSFAENAAHATIHQIMDYYPKSLHPKLMGMHYDDEIDADSVTAIRLVKQGVPLQICMHD